MNITLPRCAEDHVMGHVVFPSIIVTKKKKKEEFKNGRIEGTHREPQATI